MTRALLALLLPFTAAAQVRELAPRDGGTLPPMVEVPPESLFTAEWLVIGGQRVLPEEVYRAVLKLPTWAGPDASTAEQVREQLTSFLHVSGYELAEVQASVEGGQVKVFIDEGALEKVVFRGRQTLNTIRFKLALDIPHDVFNRPELERQVKRLQQQLGLPEMRLILVPSTELKHVGPQLENLPDVKGFELLHARRAYELHIVLPDREWDTGVGLDVRTGYVDGLELRGNYQGRSGIFIDDRWRLTAWAAAGLRQHLVTGALYPHFSRVSFDGEYFFPAITGSGTLRPAVQLEASLLSRQRADLNLVDYYASVISGAGWMEWEPSRGIRIQFGGGVYDRRLFLLVPLGPEKTPPPLGPGVGPEAATRPFAGIRLDFTFDPDNERWDRHHILLVDFQHQFPGIGGGALAWTRLYYRYVQPFGWHDLWIRAQGFAVWYDSSFHDESSLGEYLHGVFGSEYVRRAASVNFEFRFSITRDIFKLGIQSEFAVYTAIDRSADRGPLQFATSFGPGLHLLLEGMFQLDVYVTFGLRPHWAPTDPYDIFGVGASLNLQKAF